MIGTESSDDSRVRDIFAECVKPRFRAPCGARISACGDLSAAPDPRFRSRALVTSVGVCVINATVMVGFAYMAMEQGWLSAVPPLALFLLACLWGLLVGGLVFWVATSRIHAAERMPALLRSDSERIEALNAGWAMPRSEVSGLIAWAVTTRDRRAQSVILRLEILTALTHEGRLSPVFATEHGIDQTRASIRQWCARHDVVLQEFKPREEDRPWTVDVSRGLWYA